MGGCRAATRRILVNLGEALELATGYRIGATQHRVESPPAEHDYFSIPFFYNPRFDYAIEPIDFPTGVLPPRSGEPAVDPANPIFAEYGYNALKSRLRSHRDVASRYYAELDGEWDAAARGPVRVSDFLTSTDAR